MGREVEIIESGFCLFDNKMEKPQGAAFSKNWKSFKKFFEENKKALLEPMDLTSNTAFHVAIRSNNPQLLTELLAMLPLPDRWRALRKKNVDGNTILHQAMNCKNIDIVDVLLKFEKEVTPPPDEEIDELEEKQLPLLELKNMLGETPLYRAAKKGNLKMLQHVAKRVPDLQMHFHRDVDRTSILHISIIGHHLDVAVWLMKVDDRLADEKDDKEFTSLQLLSKMPLVFRSHSHLGTVKNLIYYFLPEQGHESEDFEESIRVLRHGIDLESGEDVNPPTSGFSRINCAIWKFLAREWNEIDRLWETKKNHMLAERLTELLVRKDNSWQRTFNVKQRTVMVLPVIKPSKVAAGAGKRLSELKKKKKEKQPTKETTGTYIYSSYTPLLLAASTGIVEIVEKIIGLYPEAIYHVSEDELNILHVAVTTRQINIYEIIKKCGALKGLANRISNQGLTLLHQVARMEFYRGGHHAGYAYELQDELRWFHRVRKIIPPYFVMHCNEDNLTAREEFEIEHAEMLKQAQQWTKETAQSCSAVAVLVATVVFAAAYTVPGGNDKRGSPVFLRSPMFLFFTIMDVVALASSLASVVMFLSILTSPFELWEFYHSLPRKLTLGFTLLFFSLTTTMLSFCATILLTIRLETNKWSSSLLYGAAIFPVTIFGLLQFPFYIAIRGRLAQLLKKLKKLVPSRFIRWSKKSKKRKYRDFVRRGQEGPN